jgi:outer membrane murein-binding lipoprotein Lpp
MTIDNETPEEQEVRRIIRVLREKPEIAEEVRRALLSEELLQLPDRFAKFVAPDGEFGRLASDVKAIAADVGDIKGRVTTLESDMTAVKGDVHVLKGDVQVLKGDVQVLKGDVQVLKGDVQVLKGDVQHIKDDLAALKGEFFEDRLRARLDDYLGDHIVGASVLSWPQIWELTRKASFGLSLLTQEEARALKLADLVLVHGRRLGSDKRVSAVVEASYRVGRHDFERARSWADILVRHGHDCLAIVVTNHPVEQQWARLAEEMGVTVVVIGSRTDAA